MLHDGCVRYPVYSLLPEEADIILDLGFGYGEWGVLLRHKYPTALIVGVDIWRPYVEAQRKLRIYDKVLCLDALAFLTAYDGPRFDLILAAELIEHLGEGIQGDEREKYVGRGFLKLCRWHAERVIVTTPMGYMKVQGGNDGNPHQGHRTGWLPKDFEMEGYSVQAVSSVYVPRQLKAFFRLIQRVLGRTRHQDYLVAWT